MIRLDTSSCPVFVHCAQVACQDYFSFNSAENRMGLIDQTAFFCVPYILDFLPWRSLVDISLGKKGVNSKCPVDIFSVDASQTAIREK